MKKSNADLYISLKEYGKRIVNDNLILLTKYLSVGILNTAIGYSVIFSLMFIGYNPELSNLIGYIIGINVSFFLNKKITFKTRGKDYKEFLRFMVALLSAYFANLITLVVLFRLLEIDKYISQILSGCVYTIYGYVFVKKFAFRKQTNI